LEYKHFPGCYVGTPQIFLTNVIEMGYKLLPISGSFLFGMETTPD